MHLNMNAFCTVAQAAEIIGVTEGRVRQMLRAGEIEGDKISQTLWLVSKRDAEKAAKITHSIGRPRSGKKSN